MKQSDHPFYPKAVPVSRLPDGSVICEVAGVQRVFRLEQLVEYIQKRENAILLEKEDPFNYVRVLDPWRRADAQWEHVRELLVLGGNRSSKSTYAAREVVNVLMEKPGARVWCLHTTAQTSIAMQQPLVWQFLPREYKGIGKKGAVTNISYTQKNGFSENTFVLPNGSQCWFMNYAQDDDVIEGGECDLIWCDELVSLEWIATLRYRLVTRRGRLLITFTAVDGYTATVKEYLTNAKTLEWADGPLLPVKDQDGNVTGCERVPLVQEARTSGSGKPARIVYFHTGENPYSDYDAMVDELRNAPRDVVLCRAYGVPVKRIAGRFPSFNEKVHVVAGGSIPKDMTRYQIVDPCSGRNWFMIWVGVDVRRRHFIYREWPCESHYIEGVGYPGPWAVPGRKLDGEKGPAQSSFGFGYERYREEIDRLERRGKDDEEFIDCRFMDSRFANSSTMGKELVTTILQECAEHGMDFIPAPGEHIDEGVEMINDLLAHDAGRELDGLNEPRLYVAEDCTNVIYALKEWTGADGKHGACKDAVDVVRYMALAGLEYNGGNATYAVGHPGLK